MSIAPRVDTQFEEHAVGDPTTGGPEWPAQGTWTDSGRARANADVLPPVLGSRFALSASHLALTILLGAVFMVANYVGLRPTDLWCHVAYGDWMIEHSRLPAEDPFLPLSEGMPVIDNAWLSQVFLAAANKLGGPELLSAIFGGAVLLYFALLAHVFYKQTNRLGGAILGAALTLAVGWSRLWTIRPEIFSAVFFALLLEVVRRVRASNDAGKVDGAGLGGPRMSRALWLGVPALFAAWANVHGSFVCGLAVLGCCWLGSALEAAWRHKSLRAAVRSPAARRWLVLGELAAAGCLFNPYGMTLLVNTLLFSGNENLRSVLEWGPLSLGGVGGMEFVASIGLMLLVFRHSRRPVPAADVLLLIVFGLSSAASVRMLTWYAPLATFVLLPHLMDLLGRFAPLAKIRTGKNLAGKTLADRKWGYVRQPLFVVSLKWTLACLLVVWTCFALSPAGTLMLGGQRRSRKQVLQSGTPLALTEHLRKHPPQGQVFNPQYWGDWLVEAGPPGLKVFATTMIHLVPGQVWRDYERIYQATPAWPTLLDRYAVTTVIVDKQSQAQLWPAIRASEKWGVLYEDEQAAVLVRRKPASKKPQAIAAIQETSR